MPIATWLPGVPTGALAGTYRRKQRRAVESFQPDAGPSIDRRAASVPVADLSFGVLMTDAQLEAFESWWSGTLAQGTLPFTRPDPRTGRTIVCRLTDYDPQEIGTRSHRVTLTLLVLP